ncbi:hypothetical protein [Micromonospora sp. NPDC049679]|uniref:DUF7660 family protein n=1 Tax=Micromonospora sp. NPDC049679 TaxID=3155920 RepID=UPI0033C5ED45
MTAEDGRPLKAVRSVDDLVTWLQWLADDVARAPDAVENVTVDRYLEACAAYLRDQSRLQARAGNRLPAQPSWQLIADTLHAATFYE